MRSDNDISPFQCFSAYYFSPFLFKDFSNNSEFWYKWNINKVHIWKKQMRIRLGLILFQLVILPWLPLKGQVSVFQTVLHVGVLNWCSSNVQLQLAQEPVYVFTFFSFYFSKVFATYGGLFTRNSWQMNFICKQAFMEHYLIWH